MPKFTVKRTIDAVVIYEAEVEAVDATAAAEYAREHEGEVFAKQFPGIDGDVIEYDARNFVTLNDEGDEIEESMTGDRL